MDFETLLAMAQTNQFFFDICAQSFKRRFANYEIVIDNSSVNNGTRMLIIIENRLPSENPRSRPQIEITNKDIRIKNIEDALKILRTFGHVIQKLHLILTNADTVESIAILQNVEKYCADSLPELTMNIGYANALQHFSKPFVKVERVSFEYTLPSAKGQPIPINQLFPIAAVVEARYKDSR